MVQLDFLKMFPGRALLLGEDGGRYWEDQSLSQTYCTFFASSTLRVHKPIWIDRIPKFFDRHRCPCNKTAPGQDSWGKACTPFLSSPGWGESSLGGKADDAYKESPSIHALCYAQETGKSENWICINKSMLCSVIACLPLNMPFKATLIILKW